MDYMKLLENCTLCMRKCNVNRNKGIKGVCNSSNSIRIARAALHFWEEPCISGKKGSGTVFFSNCNLKCVFCQNYKISSEGFGTEITIETIFSLIEYGKPSINMAMAGCPKDKVVEVPQSQAVNIFLIQLKYLVMIG